MICEICNLGLVRRYENSSYYAVSVQRTLNWHNFCRGGGCSLEQYHFNPLKNFLDAFLFSGRKIAMTELFVFWNCFYHFN